MANEATSKESGPVSDSEFPFTWADFRQIAAIVHAEAGIVLGDSKAHLVYTRLAKRLRAIGLRSFRDYCDLIKDETRGERQALISAMTTNVTRFFREEHHFEFLAKTVLPSLAARVNKGGRMRIWSAGCSSGEEPYSIGMTVAQAIPDVWDRDALILATDIDPEMLAKGRAATYSTRGVEEIPQESRRFLEIDRKAQRLEIGQSIKQLVRFNELNLLAQWPMRGKFDAIFCRNVMIYFDDATQNKIWARFASCLAPGGYLFIGHSERIATEDQPFELVAQTTYRLAK
jgi:chemotaxis protein methyltransferase CheR